ncbi:Gm7942 [Phodopus roborovskii]|uniref:Gm7942 protein n=1 Tax=Phodopus roborovskii TaxID=109678 RepID=A0AAU9ZVG9_PHORO|nr:Gm7942 [Phodopus roborovskii]
MSVQTPGTLMKQAMQALLRNEDLAISALDQLPMELFPALFKDAFKGRHTRVVKAMVAAWPFPCLPVGTLMKTPDLESFQAVLDAVDMQLAREFHPRREKIKELDLRKVRHDFWTMWPGTEDADCSSETGDEEKVVKVPEEPLGDSLHHCLPPVTVRLELFPLLPKPGSAQTSGPERCGLMAFRSYASRTSARQCGTHSSVPGLAGL